MSPTIHHYISKDHHSEGNITKYLRMKFTSAFILVASLSCLNCKTVGKVKVEQRPKVARGVLILQALLGQDMELQLPLSAPQSMRTSTSLSMNKFARLSQIINVQLSTNSSAVYVHPPSPRSARVTVRETVQQSLTPSMNKSVPL